MNFLFLLSVLLMANDAYAYLDPGTGSLMLQSLIAGATGALFVIKTYWHKIKSFFGASSPNTDMSLELTEHTNDDDAEHNHKK